MTDGQTFKTGFTRSTVSKNKVLLSTALVDSTITFGLSRKH